MLSPLWLYAIPALFAGAMGLFILAAAGWAMAVQPGQPFVFGNYWVILASALVSMSQISLFLGLATQIYGIREGYRRANGVIVRMAPFVTLETMLVSGAAAIVLGLAVLTGVSLFWGVHGFGAFPNVLPPVLGALLLTLGVQNIMCGFLMAILGGNQARFLEAAERSAAEQSDDGLHSVSAA
jgi:hypothetical protein